MNKQLSAFALLLCLLASIADGKYIGPDPPKGCSSYGCKCTGALSRSIGSNTSSSISASEGNLTETAPVSKVGSTLALNFVYNSYNADSSRATVDTVMGYGWTHSFNVLLFSQAGVMFRWDGDGRVTRYGLGPGGTFISAPGYFETLTQSGGVFMITQKDQTEYTFKPITGSFLVSGPVYMLTQIVDRNGNTTTLTYSGGNLTTVTDTYGRTLTFTYNAQGKLSSVKDPLGRVSTLTYDATGHKLMQITDPNGKSLQYSYNVYHQLTNKTDKAVSTIIASGGNRP